MGDDACCSLLMPYIEKLKVKKKMEKQQNYYILHKKSLKNIDTSEKGESFKDL